ncbi:MAG: hypothetical protein M3042_03075 [Actinomycetota bacterium]|nr:hypothetical protein [Actinomycetota bacterium]
MTLPDQSVTDPASRPVFGLAGLLWPAPARIRIGRDLEPGWTSVAEYLPVPSATDPRLLLPRRPRRAAAAALRHQTAGSRQARLRRGAGALGVAAGLAELSRRPLIQVQATGQVETIEAYLAGRLGEQVVLSLHLGKPRANRKPVVQILTPSGRALGFAKIGVDRLTNDLVRTEALALGQLARAPRRHFGVAAILATGSWNDLEVLVTEALPVWRSGRVPSAGELTAAAREIAGLVAPVALTVPEWLRASGLLDRLAGLPDSPGATAVRQAVDALVDRADETRLECGAWHGDWTPWNTAVAGSRLLVWDWERFAAPAPLGFDALHHALQQALVPQRRNPRLAVAELAAGASALLAPYDVGPTVAPLVTIGYLAELAVRYLRDGQEAAGARLGRVGEWLVPELRRLTQQP